MHCPFVFGADANNDLPVRLSDLRLVMYNSFTLRPERMKYCPECRRSYADETLNFCLDDGSRLAFDVESATTEMLPRSGNRFGSAAREVIQQNIQFAETADGVRIAYASVGSGPMLVRVLGHFTHLEMEWEWPDLRYLWERLAERFTVVRYDGRGIGLSDKYSGEFTEETRELDLDAVLHAVSAENASLLAISEGGWTSAIYAQKHPNLISRLILYGSYCRGAKGRPGYDAEEDAALITLIRKGWGRDTPAFRQLFTSSFFRADADPKLIAHFNDLQRASADPETAARYWGSIHSRGDGREIFRKIAIPTLVVHCQEDLAVNADEGRLLASTIPGARLVLLPSGTHYFPTDREVVNKVVSAISRFMDE
jgi:pimeloyl-ACP methyl ester carboxylesterase